MNRHPIPSPTTNDSVFAKIKFKISVRHPHEKSRRQLKYESEAQIRISAGDTNLGINSIKYLILGNR